MKLLTVLLACALVGPAWADETQPNANLTVSGGSVATIASVSPARTLVIVGRDGRQAVVDFSGEQVEYRGDLPVGEGAKLFFESLFGWWKTCPSPSE